MKLERAGYSFRYDLLENIETCSLYEVVGTCYRKCVKQEARRYYVVR